MEGESRFRVSPEGETEDTGEKKPKGKKKRKILGLKRDRTFVADSEGNVEKQGSDKKRLHVEDEGFVDTEETTEDD